MSEAHDRPVSPDGGCGDAAVYLLGLLDEERAAAFLEHARGCAVCGDELGALAPAVDILPATVPQLPAPAHVKERVMAVARSEVAQRSNRAAQDGEAVQDGETAWKGAAGGLGETAGRGEAVLRGRKTVRVARSGRRPAGERLWGRGLRLGGAGGWQLPGRRRALALLASAALLAGGVAIGALSSHFAGRSTQRTRVVSAEVTPASASAALHESGGHVWLTVVGMPAPPAGRVYEVWVKRPGGPPRPTSSLFTPTASGTATVAVPGTLTGAGEVMVTQEPAGGSQVPTSPAVIVAHLV
jgi:hypothetical protein